MGPCTSSAGCDTWQNHEHAKPRHVRGPWQLWLGCMCGPKQQGVMVARDGDSSQCKGVWCFLMGALAAAVCSRSAALCACRPPCDARIM